MKPIANAAEMAGATATTCRNIRRDLKWATREEWLEEVAEGMAPWFANLGHPLPKARMSVGFPSTGSKGRAVGQCWPAAASADGTHEILIRPDCADEEAVAAILAHELTHAAVGIPAGHGPLFRTIATGIGLGGKMRATKATEAFKRAIAPILATAGPIPHARLSFGASSGPKAQKGRLVKVQCPICGYTARTTRKWLDSVGAPGCPDHGAMVEGATP